MNFGFGVQFEEVIWNRHFAKSGVLYAQAEQNSLLVRKHSILDFISSLGHVPPAGHPPTRLSAGRAAQAGPNQHRGRQAPDPAGLAPRPPMARVQIRRELLIFFQRPQLRLLSGAGVD